MNPRCSFGFASADRSLMSYFKILILSATLFVQQLSADSCNILMKKVLVSNTSIYRDVPYVRLNKSNIHISDIAEPDDIVISIYEGGHSLFFYKGYRIDSKGSAGFQVKSFIKKGNTTSGELAVVIKNISQEKREELDYLIESFEVTGQITCTAVTCKYLTDSNGPIKNKFYYPMRLINSLVDYKSLKQTKNLEFYTLNNKTIDQIQKHLKFEMVLLTPVLLMTYGALSFGITASGYVITNLFVDFDSKE